MLRSFEEHRPQVPNSAFVEPSAVLIGDVVLGDEASVWFGAVVRADLNRIVIGARSNVQDLSVLHVTREQGVVLAEDVTLGHRVTIHGATIGRHCLIGIGAIVLDGARIGDESLVAAGAVVTPGAHIPPRSFVAGLPGRVVRALTSEEIERIRTPARNYVKYAARYLADERRQEPGGRP